MPTPPLRDSAASIASPPLSPLAGVEIPQVSVNDTHSQLNFTRVDRIVTAGSEAALRTAIAAARAEGKPVSIAGGRHAMGGQQFATGAVLIDTRALNRILARSEEHTSELQSLRHL